MNHTKTKTAKTLINRAHDLRKKVDDSTADMLIRAINVYEFDESNIDILLDLIVLADRYVYEENHKIEVEKAMAIAKRSFIKVVK